MKVLCAAVTAAVILCCSCRMATRAPLAGGRKADSLRVIGYISKGDSAYSARADLTNINAALGYYDSAGTIAQALDDSMLLAFTYIAKAGVYNAWNSAPGKTIEYYEKANNIISSQPRYPFFKYSTWYLLAHSYDKEKGKDSIKCAKLLQAAYDSIARLPDSIKRNGAFFSDFAWVAGNNDDYALAEKILDSICYRDLIVNDPSSNNYLDHYYLTRARTDIFGKKLKRSLYLDSLQMAFDNPGNNFDRVYYGSNLQKLYGAMGDYKNAYKMQAFLNTSGASAIVNGDSSLKEQLAKMEYRERKANEETELLSRKNRNMIIFLLALSLLIITPLFIKARSAGQKYRRQSLLTIQANEQLDEKVNEVNIANKEIQHRIKNNLQMIFSLLQMQERKSANPETIDNLKTARLRIESIAALHDLLSPDEFRSLNFKEYTGMIVRNILNCYEAGHGIITRLDVEDVQLNPAKSFSLGLIINEWITNSIKYADPGQKVLELRLDVMKRKGRLLLEYSDSGKPENSPGPQKAGLGKEIIEMVRKQLKGELTTASDNPYHYFFTVEC